MTASSEVVSPVAVLDEIEVTVEKIIAGGEGLARHEGMPLFIARSAPGDRLRVKVTQRRPSFGRAEIVEVLEPGPTRREAPCPYFSRCGGCDLQHIEDAAQSRFKAEAVRETLRRLGGVDVPADFEVVTGDAWGYRLRTQLRVEPPLAAPVAALEDASEEESPPLDQDSTAADPEEEPLPRVGYHERGSWTLVPVAACPILVPELEGMLPALPEILSAATLGAAPQADTTQPKAAQTRGFDLPARVTLAAGDVGAVVTAPKVPSLPSGEVSLTVGDTVYRYDANCFFQAHRGLVGRLIELVVGDFEGIAPEDTAFDLYAGVGLFSLALARRYGRVVAVEGDRSAARYARINARRNKLANVEVIAKAVEVWLPQWPADATRVVVDPPRAGLTAPIRRMLKARPPRRLTYVSCHAATLARDLKVLEGVFEVESVVAVDLFPQTGHMETVVQLVAAREPS